MGWEKKKKKKKRIRWKERVKKQSGKTHNPTNPIQSNRIVSEVSSPKVKQNGAGKEEEEENNQVERERVKRWKNPQPNQSSESMSKSFFTKSGFFLFITKQILHKQISNPIKSHQPIHSFFDSFFILFDSFFDFF